MNRLRLILILFLPFALSLAGQTRIKLWGEHPKSFSMRQTNITVYRAPDSINKGMAVIVCPGGSYCYLGMKTEGKEVAHWLADNGITAIVLHYRVGILLNHHPAMIQDLQRALLWARCNASDYGFRKDRIGVMGFSAGGHLAGMASIFFQHNYLDTLGIKAVAAQLRPDFAALIYPVVSMEDSIVNEFSRKNLLGRKESSHSMQSALSLDEHVVENTPPMFIVACRDDKVVDYRNSRALYNAMLMKKAQCEFHLFDHGGHGFGVNENKAGKEAAQWKSFFINWLNTLFN